MAAHPPKLLPGTRFVRFCDRLNEFLICLTLLVTPLFFIILTRDQFELPKLTVFRILTWLMLGVWGLRIVAAKRLDFRTTPLDLPILIWSGLQILTTVISASPYVSYRGEYENFRGLLTVLNYMVFYYIAVNFIRTREQINRVLFTILIAGLLATSYGIAQFFGIDFIAWNPTSIAPGRYFSTMGNPNFLAAYLAMVMPLLIIFFIETSSPFRKALLFISFVVMFTALLGTWSRGGFLGLLAALGVLIIFGLVRAYRNFQKEEDITRLGLGAAIRQFTRHHKAWMLFCAVVIGIVITISATFGKHHMLRMADTIIHLKDAVKISRFHIWGPALGMIKDYPVLGTGLDTFKTVFPRYATPAFAAIDGANVSSRTAHNEILQVLATQGMIGLLIVAWLTFLFLRNWQKAYAASNKNWQDRLVLVGLLASWMAYSVQNLFSFGVVAIDSFYWIIIALTVLLQDPPEKQLQKAPVQEPAAKPIPLFAFLNKVRMPTMAGVVVLSGFMCWQIFNDALADYAYNLGTIYRLRQMLDHSLFAFSKSAELTPTEVKYVVYKGLAYEEKAKDMQSRVPVAQQMEMVKESIKAYARGVEMNKTNAYYLGNLGRAYALADALEPTNPEYFPKAVDYYQQAILYAPVTVLFYQNLAMLYLSHKQESKFKDVMKQLAGYDKNEASILAFNAGNHMYSSDQLTLAKDYYALAVEYNPNYVEAHFNLGVTFARLGNGSAAVSEWMKTLECNPNFMPAKQMLERFQANRVESGQSIMLSSPTR